LSLACSACGYGNEPGEHFCGGCGTQLGDVPAPRPPEGERRQVSVLFADVVGFTSLSERLDPEAVREIMDGCFAVLTSEVERYGGSINAFTGDGIMALFGAPLAEEDHAARAVHAALRIQEALLGYGADVEGRIGAPFRMRVGLNTGVVVAGGIGDGSTVEYTALGDTINLAARLEQAAQPGGVLAGQATWRAAGDVFSWREVGPLAIKGKSDPVAAYEPLAAGDAHSRFDALTKRGLTNFVGRQAELDTLIAAWDEAGTGQGRVVSIVGEAGLGKSRLLHEFKGELTRRHVPFHEGSCFTYGETISYLPFLEIVRGLLGLRGDGPEGEARQIIEEHLAKLALSADIGPYLSNLLGAGPEDELVAHQSSPVVRIKTLEALRRLVLAEAARTPVVLILEDVHWIDKASEEVLAGIVEAMTDAPLLIVLVYRPQYLHAWGDKAYHAEISLSRLGGASSAAMVRAILGKPYAARLALERLSPEDSQTMVRTLLGTATIPAELEELVGAHTDGNPLFIEELTRDLLERGELVREDDRYVLTRPTEALALPTTVHGVLLARVDRLNPELRSILQVAAVLGRVFSHQLLGAVADVNTGLDQALLQLEDLDFVYPTALAPERQYSFKHVLAQEAVYQTLVRSRREAHHEKAGQAIETLYADRLEEFYELLAYHYARSGNDDKAFEYLDLANQKAIRANAVAEAIGYFGQAMDLLDRMPVTDDNQHRRIALLANQFVVFFSSNQLPAYFELLTRFRPVADEQEDIGLQGVYAKQLGHCQWLLHHGEDALDTLLSAVDLCERGAYIAGAGMASCVLAWVHLTLGNYDEVPGWESKALQAFAKDFEPHYYMWTRAGATYAYSETGRWQRAFQAGLEGVRVGEEYGDDSLVAFSAFSLCAAFTRQGDFEQAVRYGELAVDKAPTPLDQAASQTWLAAAWCRMGQASRAGEVLAELSPLYRASGVAYGQLFNDLYLGEAYWRLGRFAEAIETLQGVTELGERVGFRFYRGSALRLLGEVTADADPTREGLARAADYFEQSIAVLDAIGAANELALAYAGYGLLCRRRGDPTTAISYLTQAREIFERLGTIVDPDLAQHLPTS
jgi:class 3 adenylate cyclase/tetratricopeptide (TPR) repeat protein